MISRIEGELVSVGDNFVELSCGSITYELLVPAIDRQALAESIGQQVTFHTRYYLEGQSQGSSFVPRLIGFGSAQQRAFFELLTTVKGMGSRKALRAMQLHHSTIASAIATKDIDLLVSLPEIGKRTGETIVAQLNGKVDRFLEFKPADTDELGDSVADQQRAGVIKDALAALVQLGEPRPHARQLIEKALANDPALDSADELVAAVYRYRE